MHMERLDHQALVRAVERLEESARELAAETLRLEAVLAAPAPSPKPQLTLMPGSDEPPMADGRRR